jgi:hypothetical protein
MSDKEILEPIFYRSINDADTYFSNQLFATDWTGASDDDKQKALIMASVMVDRLRFKGVKNSLWDALVAAGGDPSKTGDQLLASTSLTEREIETANEGQFKQWPRDGAADPELWRLTITANNGNYTLTFNGVTTANILYNATVADITAALELLTTVDPGDFTVTVTEGGTDGVGPYDLQHAGTHNNSLSATNVDLSGGGSGSGLTLETVNDNVPRFVAFAIFEEARELLSGRDPQQEYRNMEITSENIGGQQASFAVSGSFLSKSPPLHTIHQIVSPRAWHFLVPFLKRGNDSFWVKSS